MKWLIAAIYIVLLSAMVQITVITNNTARNASEALHFALEDAAHAASMMVSPTTVSAGGIVFDPSAADQVFRKTLADNLNLDETTLQPSPGSPFQSGAVIDLEAFYDYSNTSFPYTYMNAQYGINVTLKGPAIVYAVQIPVPRLFNSAPNYPLIWTDVQAYPDAD